MKLRGGRFENAMRQPENCSRVRCPTNLMISGFGSDGHLIGFEPLICRDDAEAIAKAKRMANRHDVELWSGARLVIRIRHKPV
jgi:hypothetical protein